MKNNILAGVDSWGEMDLVQQLLLDEIAALRCIWFKMPTTRITRVDEWLQLVLVHLQTAPFAFTTGELQSVPSPVWLVESIEYTVAQVDGFRLECKHI